MKTQNDDRPKIPKDTQDNSCKQVTLISTEEIIPDKNVATSIEVEKSALQSSSSLDFECTSTDHTYLKHDRNIDSSQETSDKSLELLNKNKQLKSKISALEMENKKYKKEIDFIEKCKV